VCMCVFCMNVYVCVSVRQFVKKYAVCTHKHAYIHTYIQVIGEPTATSPNDRSSDVDGENAATESNGDSTAATATPEGGNGETTGAEGQATAAATASDDASYGADSQCDPSNPDCSFWQDAYDDAYY
jgi:hypothetical protein